MGKTVYHTACHICHGSCIAQVTVEDGRVTGIRPDPDGIMNTGQMCPKGIFSKELIYHPDRLLHPMKRTGPRGSGQYAQISWDEAYDIIAENLRRIEQEYGMEAVAIAQGTGRHHLPYTARFANAIGAPNWFEPGSAQRFFPRIHSGAVTFGYAPAADYYSDVNPQVMLVWGCNPSVSGADGESRYCFLDALKKGTRLVVVDPCRNNLEKHADAALLVNATPVGTYPGNGEAPADLRRLPRLEGVADLIYNPKRTALLLQAEELGIPRAGGLTMLVAQALRSSEQFQGKALDAALIPAIEKELERSMRNIILGPLADVDVLVEETAGLSIPEIFARGGEALFRRYETEALAQLGKQSGIILSTGGGCVTRLENYPLLHQNGTIFWLRREVAALSREGRPLSLNADLRNMAAVRENEQLEDRKLQYLLNVKNMPSRMALANAHREIAAHHNVKILSCKGHDSLVAYGLDFAVDRLSHLFSDSRFTFGSLRRLCL